MRHAAAGLGHRVDGDGLHRIDPVQDFLGGLDPVSTELPLVPMMGFNAEGVRHLLEIFYHYGLEWEVIPCVIFLGLGAMTDFKPLIANPRTLIIGAGAQLGVFITFIGTG